jgi:hypothetical protein
MYYLTNASLFPSTVSPNANGILVHNHSRPLTKLNAATSLTILRYREIQSSKRRRAA